MSKNVPAIDIGISADARAGIAAGLSRVLADTYSLYFMKHGLHWNVTGPLFQTLHLMFEQHYNELWTATDLIAERIRSLGSFAPGSYQQLAKLTSIEVPAEVPAATDMIRRLVSGHEAVARQIRATFPTADGASDQV